MAEQTSLVAQQVRLMHWAEQIRECQNRPEGMDVSTWCEQNNITKANYYYRLKRVRQMCLHFQALMSILLRGESTTNARTIIWHQFCFLLFFKLLKVLLDTELGVS